MHVLQTYILDGIYCLSFQVFYGLKWSLYRVLSGEYSGNNCSFQLGSINSASYSATYLICTSINSFRHKFFEHVLYSENIQMNNSTPWTSTEVWGRGEWEVTHVTVISLYCPCTYTGWFMTCGYYCRRWLPWSVWLKSSYKCVWFWTDLELTATWNFE